jgi:formate/nitrite transporter FocA (FNT family)
VGLVVGLFVHDRSSLVRSSLLGLTAALLWGLGVAVVNGSIKTFVGGAVLALANLVVGAAFPAALRNIWRLFAGKLHTTTR